MRTLCADGQFGALGYGPFDRIIVAVRAWDIPPAWTQQLAPDDGRLVVSLLTRGLSRTWELVREDGHLVNRSNLMTGFVPMQGRGNTATGRSRWTRSACPYGVMIPPMWTAGRWPG